MNVVFPRNDNTAWLRGLKNPKTGAYINNATVTWELRTDKYPDGTVVASGSGVYLAGSNGDYEIAVDDAISIAAGTKYVFRIIATSASGKVDMEDFVTAKGRTGRTSTS